MKTLKINRISSRPYSGDVYDLSVVKNHNFLADGVVIHNCGKKRYILNVLNNEGVEYKEPVIKVTGIEAIKSSTPFICRDALTNSFKIMMNGTESQIQDYIKKFKEDFKTRSFEEIAIPKGVSNINYKEGDKAIPINSRGSIVYNALIEKHKLQGMYETISNGDKIKYCYLKTPNVARSNVIASPGPLPKEFGLEKYIDYNTQFDKTFMSPLKIILDAIGWEAEKRSRIDSFFE